MKISELISKPQAVQDKYGDAQSLVEFKSAGGNETYGVINKVVLIPQKDGSQRIRLTGKSVSRLRD